MWIDIPPASPLLNHKTFNWNFEMEAEDGAGRRIPCPRGRTLGGSSSINGMLYVRGQPLDYDTWGQLGNRGWSYEQVLPYFKKSEHFELGGDDSRGKDGLLNVAEMRETHELCDAFIDAAEASGYPKNKDYNNGNQEGFGYYQVTMKDGKRWSTARAFLDPARSRPNLRIETDALVDKVILEGKRCVGVAYSVHGQKREARVNREVIVSCGSVQSPGVLEHSGIGQPELLRKHGIEVRHGWGVARTTAITSRRAWRVKLPITLNEQTTAAREASLAHTRARGAHRRRRLRLRPHAAGPRIARHAVPHGARELRHRAEAAAGEGTRHDGRDRPVPARLARLDPHQVGDTGC
jgi:choline dehydrogenase